MSRLLCNLLPCPVCATRIKQCSRLLTLHQHRSPVAKLRDFSSPLEISIQRHSQGGKRENLEIISRHGQGNYRADTDLDACASSRRARFKLSRFQSSASRRPRIPRSPLGIPRFVIKAAKTVYTVFHSFAVRSLPPPPSLPSFASLPLSFSHSSSLHL